MNKIALYCGSASEAQQLGHMLEEYFSGKRQAVGIDVYTAGEELMACVEKYKGLFFDVSADGFDYAGLGKRLEEGAGACRVIALIVGDKWNEWYERARYINAQACISRPFEKSQVEQAAEGIFSSLEEGKNLEMYRQRIKHTVLQKDIMLLKAYDGYVLGYTESGLYRMDKALGQVWDILEKQNFFRVSRSAIVNMKYIKEYVGGELLLGKEKVRVSRACKRDFEKAYARFCQNDF